MRMKIGISLLLCHYVCTSCNTEPSSNNIKNQLRQVINYVEQRDFLDTTISTVSVAWHIDHTLKVVNNIAKTLENSNPDHFKSAFNPRRLAVFASGKMPRGVGKAGPSVTPPNHISNDSLHFQFENALLAVDKMYRLRENHHFEHPVFGRLNRNQTLRFIEIHNNHHMDIIDDILASD